MRTSIRTLLAAAITATACAAPLMAHAGMFDDDEARRAILDLRAKIDAVNNRVDGKADKGTTLDLAAQNDQLKAEIARLRGQIEVLTNDLANEQRRQKDFYADLDGRLRKLEPQQMTVDGKDVQVQPGEQQAYEAALSQFKSGDYKAASLAFAAFLRSYPKSGFAAAANYWLGNAYYAQKDYRNAIAAQQIVVSSYADNPKAPDAMLNIASSYTEMKDRAAAKKALENLIAQYPDSNAAQTARQRLGSLK